MLAFFYHLFLLCAESYVMSPDLFIVNKGLLQKSVTCLPHLQLKDYRVHQSRLMNYLDIVTISFVTKDDQQLMIKLKGIDRTALQSAYRNIIDQLESRQAGCKYLLDLFEKLTHHQ
ncbi:hypothetical protein CKK33_18920 [Mucilaginibacter sp. MD40]|nr:hypothetical protein CKK33_18920 [Mucilaginibacter sp. MD40]